MDVVARVFGILLVVLLVVGVLAKDKKCSTCDRPIYNTKAGWRHKPGHAPEDRHAAVPPVSRSSAS